MVIFMWIRMVIRLLVKRCVLYNIYIIYINFATRCTAPCIPVSDVTTRTIKLSGNFIAYRNLKRALHKSYDQLPVWSFFVIFGIFLCNYNILLWWFYMLLLVQKMEFYEFLFFWINLGLFYHIKKPFFIFSNKLTATLLLFVQVTK